MSKSEQVTLPDRGTCFDFSIVVMHSKLICFVIESVFCSIYTYKFIDVWYNGANGMCMDFVYFLYK